MGKTKVTWSSHQNHWSYDILKIFLKYLYIMYLYIFFMYRYGTTFFFQAMANKLSNISTSLTILAVDSCSSHLQHTLMAELAGGPHHIAGSSPQHEHQAGVQV